SEAMLPVNLDRLMADLEEFSAIGGDGKGGVTRLAFTPPDQSARRLFQDSLAAAGLAVRLDAVGNVFGRRQGRENSLPPLLLGSHLDSVPSGGRFDGPLGVLSALEVARALDDGRTGTRRPIEIACFVAEESSRFGTGTLGSRAVVGKLTSEMLDGLRDAEGRTLAEILRECGLSPERLGEARRLPGEYHAYLELHLEQGAILEHAGIPVGLVTGIAAPTRFRVTYTGRADHSGATPMGLRRDALVAAAELVLSVRRIVLAHGAPTGVGTVGVLRVLPGAMNVIPGQASLGIDLRDIAADAKQRVARKVQAAVRRIARKWALEVSVETLADEAPVPLPERIRQISSAACRACEIPFLELPSGAGHDAMYLAEIADTGMIFTRCREGISHNPAEFVDPRDVAAGATVLAETALRLANE
ncbi:MAG TPA: Zn-dependent hydrolase, partial [Candidatus Acidoferrum sp.]|nr:Zn-dependent hydrolase [Candidatus Acidoferrum sp.]